MDKQKLLRRIQDAAKKRQEKLDLSGRHIKKLPAEIGQLKDLTTLNLGGNQLASLPAEIWQLANLTVLDLSYNKLGSLPAEIGQLANLTELDLTDNQLSGLPAEIWQLKNLTTLDLSYNKLASLPAEIWQLANLAWLDLFNNQLSGLSAEIGQLTNLTGLDLRNNQLASLPPEFWQLTNLTTLYLDRNQLVSLPAEIGQLTNLKYLHLTNNQLASLPPEIGKLTNLKELYLHENPELGLPDEVLGPTWLDSGFERPVKPPKEILDYYFSTRGKSGQPLRELRLIVVGRPKVGKTSIIKRLRGLPMDTHEVETHGIDIQPLDLECPDGTLHARIWDFGGQHVLHAMHEFFLRKRCLYLLVVEQRAGDVERDLTYWLQLIRSYAGDAPVVVALNQSKGIPRSLARATLERDYGPILAWVATECAPEEQVSGANATIELLRKALIDAAAAMPEPKKLFPRKWIEIKNWLEGMKEPYLEYAAYARHCAELHETDSKQQEALAAAMDELGVALNYARDPRLHDTTVLRPNWLANGIYAILRANILLPKPLAQDGVLTLEKVGQILDAADHAKVLSARDYPPAKWEFLLRLMNLFQLSFPLDDKGKRCLVPTLLPADEPPDSAEPDGPGVMKLRYEFDVVPGPLMARLLVRIFALIDGCKAWQRGAMLRYANAQGRVWADLSETYVYVTVAGEEHDRAELLEMIRETLRELFREYERLRVVEQWRYNNDWVPRRTLEEFEVLPREEYDDDALQTEKGVRHED